MPKDCIYYKHGQQHVRLDKNVKFLQFIINFANILSCHAVVRITITKCLVCTLASRNLAMLKGVYK
jgi:hypothetical protein